MEHRMREWKRMKSESQGENGGSGKEKFVYIGKYYRLAIEEDRRGGIRGIKRNYLICGLVSVAWLLAMGFLNPPGSRLPYVLFPYGLTLLFAALTLQSAISVLFSKRIFTREEGERSFFRARRMTVLAFVFSLAAAGGELAVILQNAFSEELKPAEYIFCLCCGLESVFLWLFLKWQKKITYKIEETQKKPEGVTLDKPPAEDG